MAGNECPDAGKFGVGGCRWRRLEVCCALWGGPCRYLGSITNTAKSGNGLDVRNGFVAEGGVKCDASHKPGSNADID